MEDQLSFYQRKLDYEIDAWDLADALKKENITVIDARSEAAFETEHIPGSVNIPHRTMNEDTTAHLSKDTLVVTYCDGIGCNASTKGAINMTRLGFRVKELMGGIDWWKRDGYATEGTNASEGQRRTCGCQV